tara:strand:+ start:1065 stop:1640 length:576 start_codon:yes stop_codon:yes gene_type:complete
MNIILGSSSLSRKKILVNAGLSFKAQKPKIDEEAQKKLYNKTKPGLALYLAEKKALSIKANKKDLVIGADQILLSEGTLFNKPKSLTEAKKHLKRLSNKTHKLISGTVIVKNNKIVWKHSSEARMSMHKLSEKDIDDYLSATGKKILSCIGAYNIEGFGSNLFKKIDGDFFSIVGLPLIDLLNALRKLSKG